MKIDRLIINSPYAEPLYHWEYNKETKEFDKAVGRRKAGYLVASNDDESGRFIEIELVNEIRPKVNHWRDAGYPGITNVTRKLLDYWHDKTVRNYPFFFCELDAIETIIWLKESHEGRMMPIPNDGGKFQRICTKLCTGGGKTIVMAMLIVWSICNKIRDIRNMNYSQNVLIITPNLTVRNRLQVLKPDNENNYYERFDIVPVELQEMMSRARIVIHNWQALAWESAEEIIKRKGIDKRGPLSDGAYARKVLRNFYENWLVINDEAHHAYRIQPDNNKKLTRDEKESQHEATIWIQGLDRIHSVRKITNCYDFSATPFIPGGKTSEERLYSWIVSDFSLNDGIESGLVKTPRVVVRDDAIPDASTYKSKLYHIYSDKTVRNSLKNSASLTETLPDLIRNAYVLLASDWQEVYKQWQASGKNIPPVMISVANCTTTAARIERFFSSNDILLSPYEGLCDTNRILRIDSQKLQSETDAEGARLREKVDTVGQEGKIGEQLTNIISVGMLSEGWDAKTVTHIMGLRAFSSQLLCEQVVGRGLRRTSYELTNDFFEPEYVNIFGVPFTFLPHEEAGTGGTVTHTNTTEIKALEERNEYRITWPNIIRLEYISEESLSLDIDSIKELELNAYDTRINVEIAPILNGNLNLGMCRDIDLEEAYKDFRLQRIIFHTASRVFDEMGTSWKSSKVLLLGQIIKLVQKYLQSKRIKIFPELFETSEERRKILYAMNMDKIIRNLWDSIRSENSENIVPIYDTFKRTRSTADMPRWWTIKPNEVTQKSHINRCVFDSTWEDTIAYHLDKNPNVKAWAKNDHLGFYVYYMYNGVIRRYVPDFLIKLDEEQFLILEVKGIMTEQDKAKKAALEDWVKAVNNTHEFGNWRCDIVGCPLEVDGVISRNLC